MRKNYDNQLMLFNSKQLVCLILPLFTEQFLSVFVGMIDVIMISYVGEAAVSGVALVDSINNLMIQILFAITTGGTVVCAYYIGRKDMEFASKSGAQLFLVTVPAMFVLSVFFILFRRVLLGMLFGSVERQVMNNAMTYMLITAVSFPFLAAYHSAASVFRAKGNSAVSMRVSLVMNIINVFGNAICIFGFDMGVEGVAIPTLTARVFAAAAMLALLESHGNELRIPGIHALKPDKHIIRKTLFIGVPGAVESGLFNMGKILLSSLVSSLGTESIAAFAVAGNLVAYLYLPGNALGIAMITVIGQCRGSGRPDQAKHYAKVLLGINYIVLAILCMGIVLFNKTWTGMYHLSSGSEALAGSLLIAHSAAMILWPAAFLLPYYFRALGQAFFAMVIAVSTMVALRIGLAYLFVMVLGRNVLWVWYAMFADWLVRALIFGYRFIKGT